MLQYLSVAKRQQCLFTGGQVSAMPRSHVQGVMWLRGWGVPRPDLLQALRLFNDAAAVRPLPLLYNAAAVRPLPLYS